MINELQDLQELFEEHERMFHRYKAFRCTSYPEPTGLPGYNETEAEYFRLEEELLAVLPKNYTDMFFGYCDTRTGLRHGMAFTLVAALHRRFCDGE